MMSGKPPPPTRVPTLTEVVSLPEDAAGTPPAAAPAPGAPGAAAPATSPIPAVGPSRPGAPVPVPPGPVGAPGFVERRANWPPIQEDQIVQRVLGDLERQVDLMLETRLRETLSPVLARATDQLARDLRNELASTLRDVVARAVAQELARHRGR